MKLPCVLLFLLAGLMALGSCGGTSEEDTDAIKSGDVSGVITDGETGTPIVGASVNIGGQVALTAGDGKYLIEDIPSSDEVEIVVTAANYEKYREVIPFHQDLLVFDVALMPVESPSARILQVLADLARDIAALDPNKIPTIKLYFSEDYAASDNLVTLAAIMVGIVPRNYDELPDAILTIIEKYNKLDFKFIDPDIEFKGDTAVVFMRFDVYAETKPPEPKKWNISVDGRLDIERQNGDWKIKYWELVSDFHKFEWEPLK